MSTKIRRLFAAAATTLTAATALTVGLPSPASAAAPKSAPVLMVHGFDGGNLIEGDLPLDSAMSCRNSAMNAWRSGLASRGHTNIRTVGYYQGDTGCDLNVPFRGDNTVNSSITDLGRDLALLIHNTYTSKGESVTISAHSMGGLVVRAALAGVHNRAPGFPTRLLVSDVVTAGSPHAGAGIAAICGALAGWVPTQCTEMAPGSAFLANLRHNPQPGSPTDWTLIGSDCDLVVSGSSAVSMSQVSWSFPAIHRVRFAQPGFPYYCLDAKGFDHTELVTAGAPLDAISVGITTNS